MNESESPPPIPAPPRVPTRTTATTEPEAPIALRDLCAELRASLDRTAELCGRVAGEIARVELAEIARSSRVSVLSDLIQDLIPRVERLEQHAPTAAEE